MTKKHYIQFAKVFRTMRPSPDAELAYNMWAELLRQQMDLFAEDNPRLNRAHFMQAAGL